MLDVFSAFGLSSAAGLNAYLPLLIVGLLARYTDLITLDTPWNALESPWVLGVLVILLIIEMTADKIPAVDTINDGIQTFVRPVAGAILFAASAQVITDIHPVLSMISGLLIAGGVHTVKAATRPVVTATTAGVGNPVVSVVEDVMAAVVTVSAIILPLITGVMLLVVLFFALRWLRRRRRVAASLMQHQGEIADG
jgi:hypothetical protein